MYSAKVNRLGCNEGIVLFCKCICFCLNLLFVLGSKFWDLLCKHSDCISVWWDVLVYDILVLHCHSLPGEGHCFTIQVHPVSNLLISQLFVLGIKRISALCDTRAYFLSLSARNTSPWLIISAPHFRGGSYYLGPDPFWDFLFSFWFLFLCSVASHFTVAMIV